MMNSEENKNMISEQEESSIDFGQILATLMKHKRLYYKVLPIAFVVACIYTLGLPNYYMCEVKLSPELTTKRSSGSLAALASQFGMNLGSGAMGSEALFPTLYPELMNSVDFKASLFNVPVHKKDSTRMMSYYDYIANEQKRSWWGTIISAPFRLMGSLLGSKDTIDQHIVDPFMLTKQQTNIVKIIDKKIVCDVDKKTMVITIDVTDQDPLIAATMADSVQQRLQDFITEYRTKKARNDLEFSKKAYAEAKVRYEQARRRYASFSDANQRVFFESLRSEQNKLNQELQIQSQVYMQASAQLQQAELDVQKDTPAFTELEPATVPVRKAGPARAKMCLIFMFLAFLGTTAFALYKEDDIKPLLGIS